MHLARLLEGSVGAEPAPVIINAASAYAGGGATLALNFLRWLAQQPGAAVVLVPDLEPFRKVGQSAGFRAVFLPPFSMRGWARWQFDEQWLPRYCYRQRARLLFTLGSIGPARPPCPHAVLVQNAFYVYGRCAARRRLSPRARLRLLLEVALFRRCVRRATRVIAQTPVMAERIAASCAVAPENLRIVENAVEADSLIPLPRRSASHFRLLTLARYYPHKNLEILPQIVRRLGERAGGFRFLTTVDAADGAAARRWLRSLRTLGVAQYFENLGRVEYDRLPELYAAADAALVPSLLESSTACYAEAMHFGLPIVTSNLDFARASCAQAAIYCDPFDADAFARAVLALAADSQLAGSLTQAGREHARAQGLTWACAAPRLAVAAGIL